MDIKVEIFTIWARNNEKACAETKKQFNEFVAQSQIGRVVSITTNTTDTLAANGDGGFTYTLTLVYETMLAVPEISGSDPVPMDDRF